MYKSSVHVSANRFKADLQVQIFFAGQLLQMCRYVFSLFVSHIFFLSMHQERCALVIVAFSWYLYLSRVMGKSRYGLC